MLTSRRIGLTAGALALGLLTACGDGTGPQGVTRAELLSDYMATTLTTDSAGVVVDRLTQHATLHMLLRADGSTAGQLYVAGAGVGGGDLDADLAGTFSFDESTGRVSFAETADSFIGEMSFTAGRHDGTVQLEARQSFGGTVVHVVLDHYVLSLTCGPGSGMSVC